MTSVEGGGGGGVLFIPGLLFSVWKWLSGGGKVDPIIDAWNRNPAGMAALWDRQIADSLQKAEDDQAELYIKTLKLIEDCSQPNAGVRVRRRRYQAHDQFDRPI